jgi:hypothetical protein
MEELVGHVPQGFQGKSRAGERVWASAYPKEEDETYLEVA